MRTTTMASEPKKKYHPDKTMKEFHEETLGLLVPEDRCIVCGEFIQYCLGHQITRVAAIYENHDFGDHRMCNPLACDDA